MFLVYKLMESCFTGLTSRMMFDFATSAGSKQKERKKERQPQSEKWLMEIIRMVRINLPLKYVESIDNM